MDETITFTSPTHSKRQSDKFSAFLDEKKFTDCKITAQNETILCHAVIISASSPVLERMLESEMKEGLNQEIIFDTIHPDIMKKMILFMYTGTVTAKKDQVLEIVLVSDYLQIDGIKECCLEVLLDILSPANVVGWMQWTALFQLDDIAFKCKKFICVIIGTGVQWERLP